MSFIDMETHPLSPAESRKKLIIVGIGVATTFLSLVPTIYATAISNSVTLLSDALRCGVEFLAIFLSWVILLKITYEDTSRYNYGFGKLERLAGLAVGSALLCTFLITLVCSLLRAFYPEQVENTFFGFGFALLSVLGNMFLWFKNYSYYKKDPSPVIDSQWRLFRAKTLATSTVVFSIGGSFLFKDFAWSVYLDPFGSFVLSIFLLNASLTLLSNSMADLLDRAVEERVQKIIIRTLENTKNIHLGAGRIRSRRSGKHTYVDIFLRFPSELSFAEVHTRVMDVKCIIERALPESEVVVIPLPDSPGAYSCRLWPASLEVTERLFKQEI